MPATTKIVRGSKPRKNKTYPVDIRITYERKSVFLPTGIFIGEKDLEPSGQVKKQCKYYKDIKHVNNYIKEKREDVDDFIIELEKSQEILFMSASDIKKAYQNRKKVKIIGFVEYGKQQVEKEKKRGSLGNATNYNDAINFFVRVSGKEEVAI